MVMEDNTRFLTNRIWRKVLMPALLSNIFVLLVIHIGAFMLVSRYCPKAELIVYSAFLPFWFLFSAMEFLLGVAGSQYFSIFKGAGNHPAAQQVFSEIFTTLLVVLIAGSLAAVWQMPHVVKFLGLPQDNVPFAIRYGRLLFACGLTDAFVSVMRMFIQADSLPRTGAVVAMLESSCLFAGMYVCLRILHRGLITYYSFFLVCSLATIGVYISFILLRKTTIRLRLRRLRFRTFKELAVLASNNIINNAGVFVVSMLSTRWLMEVFGPAAVTIFALLGMLQTCFTSFRKGDISTMQSLVGIYRGEANENGIRYAFKKGFFSSLYLQLAGMLFLLCFPELICRWLQVLENYPGEAILAVRLFALSIIVSHIYIFLSSYYVICGYGKFISIFVLLEICLSYFPVTAYFILVLRNEELCWWYCPASWALTNLLFLLAIQWKKRRGKFADFMLIPKDRQPGKQYHFLLKNRTDDFHDYRIMLEAFLRKHAIEPKVGERAKHLFEELFLFAGERIGDRKDALFFMVITILEQKVELALRYDSKESCLNSILNGSQTVLAPEHVAGAKILSRLSDEIYIDRIYGINYVRLTLNRKK